MKIATNKPHLPGITVGHNMPDYSKDPYVIKKVERARAFIAKNGLPKDKQQRLKKGHA